MTDNPDAQTLWTRRGALVAGAGALGGLATLPQASLSPTRAASGKRLALVITNQEYAGDIGKLTNTYRDGDLMVDALRATGFDLPAERIVRDANKEQFRKAFQNFAVRLQEAGSDTTSVFYYSGHGSAGGPDQQNYAVPIGATIESAADLPTNGIELRWMLNKLYEAGAPTNFVFFDACRDLQKVSATKGGTKGLRPEGIFGGAPNSLGRVLMYATSAGETAADNNIFATTLAEEIKRSPGQAHPNLATLVQNAVYARSDKKQLPQFEPGFVPDLFYFQPPGASANQPSERAPSTNEPAQRQPQVLGVVWRLLETFENGRLYFKKQARVFKQPSRIADQIGMIPAGEEIKSRIEYADAGQDGVWYKFTDNFGATAYVRASDALALRE